MEQVYEPIQDKKRIAIIDVLRGWALLGVVLMNYDEVYKSLGKTPNPDSFDKALIFVARTLFEFKSVTMLSFLFGYGFAVLIDNLSAKKLNPVPFFARRMFWLLIIAVINSAIWFGDILKDYAVLGLVLLLFYKCSAKTVAYIALFLLIVNPFFITLGHDTSWVPMATKYFKLYQSHDVSDVLKSGIFGTFYFEMANRFYLIAAHETLLLCMMTGLAAQKVNFLGRLAENKKYIKRTFWISLSVTVLLSVSLGIIFSKYPNSTIASVLKVYNLGIMPRITGMAFTVSAICWLYLAGKLRRFFSLLQSYGKMTLTNYITQDILAVLIFSGIGLRLGAYGISYGMYMVIALAIYVAQIYASKWWLSVHQYGPVEWIWRQLSYRKKLPIKIQKGQRNIDAVLNES